jgi:hypothetical protein
MESQNCNISGLLCVYLIETYAPVIGEVFSETMVKLVKKR